MTKDDALAKKIYDKAVRNGCRPKWASTLIGVTWACTCRDGRHQCDQQCSAISLASAGNKRTPDW